MYISKWFVAVLISLLLVACGGDDGGSKISNNLIPTIDNPPNNTRTMATINSQNSRALAGAALKSLFDTSDFSGILSDIPTGIGTGFVSGVDIDNDFNLVSYTKRQMERVERSGISAASTFVTGAVLTMNDLACDESGTNDMTWADNDNNEELSVGDMFTITAHNCIEDGETTHGQISFTLLGNEPNLSMSFVFTDFTIIDFEGSSTLDGDLSMNIKGSEESIESVSISSNTLNFSDLEMNGTFDNFSLTTTKAGTLESLSMTADALTFVEADVTKTPNNFSFTDFSFAFSEDSNTLLSTLALTGTFSESELGELVSFDTLQPFEELASDDFPYAGIMKITAPDNSSVTMTALDAVNIRLEVDENGDGAIDETSDMTWASLDI